MKTTIMTRKTDKPTSVCEKWIMIAYRVVDAHDSLMRFEDRS